MNEVSLTRFKQNRWTETEDAILRERYPHEQTANLILAFPSRTLRAIKTRAEFLGLKKTPEYREALLEIKRRQSALARKGKPAHNRQPRVTVQCRECGISVEVSPRRAKELQFCSLKCKGLARRRIPAEEDPRYTRVEKLCEWCGNVFLTHPCKIRLGEGRFCSRSCVGSSVTHNMQRVSRREREFCGLLADAGLVFEAQAKVGRWNVDVYFPDQRLVVEFDGDYWHSMPDVRKRDKRKTTDLEGRGYRVLRVLESVFVNSPQKALSLVEQELDPQLLGETNA